MPPLTVTSETQDSEGALRDLLREDGTLDLGGFNVARGDDGMLRASAGGQWLPGEGHPGTNNAVLAFAWGPDGALYAGGLFTEVNGIAANRIARWMPNVSDGGGSWSPLGSGVNGPVSALAWGPDGALYVGGDFAMAGGVPGTGRLARWTPDAEGGSWSAVGSGVDGPVAALTWGADGALYVGGWFFTAGNVENTRFLARWTPEGASGTWGALGTGVSHAVDSITRGPDGAVYVGGDFSSAGGVPGTSRIARWTPGVDTWSALGLGLADGRVSALQWGTDGALYVGGSFTQVVGVEGTGGIARWTPGASGGTWSALGAGLNGSVGTLAWGPDDTLHAGGGFRPVDDVETFYSVAQWMPDEGGTWHAVGTVLDSYVAALTWDSEGALYVGGNFSNQSAPRYVARWTQSGGEWRALGEGLNGSVMAAAWGPDGSLYVGGGFMSVANVTGTRSVARWTPDGSGGGTWSALGSGLDGTVFAMTWGGDGALYVGGTFTTAGGVDANHVARWTPDENGGAWAALGVGTSDYVWALTWGEDGSLYVGGEFARVGEMQVNRIARWTPDEEGVPGTWSTLGSGVSGGLTRVRALTWDPAGALVVGGRFTSAGGELVNNIARWTPGGNDGMWEALDSGTSGGVHALALAPDGALYVGGEFASAGGLENTSNIARWTPGGARGAWSALGSVLPQDWVEALAWGPDDALYVGGGFFSVGGIDGTSRLARWEPGDADGTWTSLGTGLNNRVETLVWGADDLLYAGGGFTTAGGMPSAYFARWAANTTSTEPDISRSAPLTFEAVYPNPFTTRTTLVFSVAAPADVHLAVYDVLGRRVATLAEEHVGAGTHERMFDAAGLPNGTYLVRLSSGGMSQTRRVMLLR